MDVKEGQPAVIVWRADPRTRRTSDGPVCLDGHLYPARVLNPDAGREAKHGEGMGCFGEEEGPEEAREVVGRELLLQDQGMNNGRDASSVSAFRTTPSHGQEHSILTHQGFGKLPSVYTWCVYTLPI
jgi:hypothetical protein